MSREDKVSFKEVSNGVTHKKFKNKEFTQRNSTLTDIFEKNYGLYHTFIIVSSLYVIQVIVRDVLETGRVISGIPRMKREFQYFHLALAIELCMLISTFGLYFIFQVWAKLRNQFYKRVSMWDYLWLTLYVLYQIIFLIVFGYLIHVMRISTILTAALCVEQVRLIMKTHSFVRSKVPMVLVCSPSQKDDNKKYNKEVATFFKYCYFLFVPTLVYQDNYPRMKSISWKFIFTNIMELILITVTCFVILDEILPYLNQYGLEFSDGKRLLINYFKIIFPIFVLYVYLQYFTLHAWQNIWGELLRFGDRLFYEDWWNCHISSQYYRKWNTVIHDWLYSYVYRDLIYIFGGDSKIPLISVFFVSALAHEYIILLSISDFIVPFLFYFYALAGAKTLSIGSKLNKKLGNCIFLSLNFFLFPLIVYVYALEYSAKRNCAQASDTSYLNFMRPYLLNCPNI